MKAWVATLSDFTGVVCEGVVSFTRMVTPSGLGRLESLLAVADLNGDGRDDIVAGTRQEYNVSVPEERLEKTPLRVFVGEAAGGFRHAPELVEGTIEARTPIVVADDFNGDGRADLAVFDAGVYVFAVRRGYGNPSQLFLSSPDGGFRPSDALADAIRREHERQVPTEGTSGPADLHLKSATSGGIDGDGDIDLWVQSGGGVNIEEHIIVNNGDGTFMSDTFRVPIEVLATPAPRVVPTRRTVRRRRRERCRTGLWPARIARPAGGESPRRPEPRGRRHAGPRGSTADRTGPGRTARPVSARRARPRRCGDSVRVGPRRRRPGARAATCRTWCRECGAPRPPGRRPPG